MTTNYEELGKQWVANEVEISELGPYKLNPKQKEFLNAKERYVLFSGGFAAGKTLPLLLKIQLLSLFFPQNRILLGRKTRQAVEQNLIPDFFEIAENIGLRDFFEHKVGPGKLIAGNGSEILLFGLDALQSGSGQDIKKAEQAIKSLNLGGVFIDQLEEIEMRVFEALSGRLRKQVLLNQMNFTTNPANFWAFDYFKQNPRPNTRLIETSMLDNRHHLPDSFIQDQLEKPDSYKQRYVYGTWSLDAPDESRVFSTDLIKDQAFNVKTPIREFDGIKIYEEPGSFDYQMGVDPSEGSVDPCAIVLVNKQTGAEVAHFGGFVPTQQIKNKVVQLAMMYSTRSKVLVVPEATGAGQALIEILKPDWNTIYEREQFLHREHRVTKKLGFYTSYSSKKLLIDHFIGLLLDRFPKIRSNATVNELKTYVYQNETRKSGAGAQAGFHDDKIMATMLAYWGLKKPSTQEARALKELNKQRKEKRVDYQYA